MLVLVPPAIVDITSRYGGGPGERCTKLLPGPLHRGARMRASDQGLLAKLGFRDADRESPRHDKACRFFTQPDIAEKVLKVAFPVSAAWMRAWRHYSCAEPELPGLRMEWSMTTGITEEAVRTKSGFHIGFIDAAVSGWYSLHAPDIEGCADDIKKRVEDTLTRFRLGQWPVDAIAQGEAWVKIEVKIGRTATSEVIRQIETYRGGLESSAWPIRWVLAVDYALSGEERRALITQRITPIRLGPAFEQYLLETDGEADVVAL